jgi:type 2 lantibiotic biosynthesis protein LanM
MLPWGRVDLNRLLGRLVEPSMADLAAHLSTVKGLSRAERQVLHDAVDVAVGGVVWRLVSRVVVLELNVARLGGVLSAQDPHARWEEWLERLSRPGEWARLAEPYPALLPRLATVIGNHCAAVLSFACRFARSRSLLKDVLGNDTGELLKVSFHAGDSHHGGRTVAIVECAGGRTVYKPRSVAADRALGRLLPRLLPDEPAGQRIRVPEVRAEADKDGAYGWAEHVRHRFCESDSELRIFYRNLGHWLAVMRLLRGVDLHSENVIACGPVPVVVDCETLFTPHRPFHAEGYGRAADLASDLVDRSVLRTGMLPGRGAVPGLRGVDNSAAGYLPGQQPTVQVPAIVDLGTDRARVSMVEAKPEPLHNLPDPKPQLDRYWRHVVDGFADLTDRMRVWDASGDLVPMLGEFADAPVRVVLRSTANYELLLRMLWHPSSLHSPDSAIAEARDVLRRQATNFPAFPNDPEVIDAEIAEMLVADIPVFLTTPRRGRLNGPRGTELGDEEDLVSAAVSAWREVPLETDRRVVKTALVAAYFNDGPEYTPTRSEPTPIHIEDLDKHRRWYAAELMRHTIRTAIRGEDGTATWIGQVLATTGYAVRPMAPDIYSGLGGVAVCLAAYLGEAARGRADPVPGLEELLSDVLQSIRLGDDQSGVERARAEAGGLRVRPEPSGGYMGLGSRIWSWLLLARLGAIDAAEAVQRAAALAAQLPESIDVDEHYDLLSGMAGAVVPLLRLAELSTDDQWRRLAGEITDRLTGLARHSEQGAHWPGAISPDGIGGVSHGVTGISWALARAAITTGNAELLELARAGFQWQDSLFNEEHRNWSDARAVWSSTPPLSWCNGSVGIGLCAADLLELVGDERWRDLADRAVRASWPAGFGADSTVCHGDLGTWELLEWAITAGLGPSGLSRDHLDRQVFNGLAVYGPLTAARLETFQPDLFIGGGGVVYQLLRMHRDSDLPSLLVPDPGTPLTTRTSPRVRPRDPAPRQQDRR